MKQLFTILFTVLSTLLFSQVSYTAEEFQAALMPAKTGAMVVYNGDKHSFSIDITGEVIPSETPNFVTVDGKIVQSTIIPFQVKMDFENMSEDVQQETLLAYMKYERNYIKGQFRSDNLNEQSEFLTLNDKLFLCWIYDMPKSYKSVVKQCYLMTMCFDHILILNAPVLKGKKLKDIKNLLITVGKTLKMNNYTLNLNQLYEELNPE